MDAQNRIVYSDSVDSICLEEIQSWIHVLLDLDAVSIKPKEIADHANQTKRIGENTKLDSSGWIHPEEHTRNRG